MNAPVGSDFYSVVLGDRTGVMCVAFGYKPFRNDAGKYKHAEWREMRYAWPAQREQLLADIEREVELGEAVDVYLCPAVRHAGAKGRRKGDALPPQVCWADLDGFPADVALFALLVEAGAHLVRSGSGDHLHAYLPLTGPIDLGTHARLNKALAARLGGDAKWSDETLLRPPGTYNWKATVPPAGQPAGPKALVEVQAWNGLRVDPADLAELLGVDLTATSSSAGPVDVAAITAEPAPDVLPPPVLRALADPDTTDRSRACARVIGACAGSGLTPGQTLAVIAGYAPAVRYKNAKHMTDDVARFHAKALAERAAQRTDPEDLVDRGPQPAVVTDDGPPSPARLWLPNLPAEFWDALPVLAHVRRGAHARLAPADLVLHAMLARLSAMTSHLLRFDSGRGPASLNYFAAPIGPSGAGKSTGARAARELLVVPAPLHRPLDGQPVPFHDGIPLGSGEGLAEAYMGMKTIEVDTPDGDTYTKKVRGQVRHNVFAVVDEGEILTKIGERSGATIGATIRSAWGGETIGQANARDDTTRIIPADSYSLGLLIGFQPATALPLVTDTAAGTAQRFAWASAIDPTIPDEHVDHPGPLDVSLVGPTFHNTLRDGIIAFPSAVTAELRSQHLAKVRGEIDVDEANSQAPLMRAKMAALLSLLDGHAAVADTHWQLAGVLLDTSYAVRDALVQRARAEQAEEIERRRQDAIERQVQAAAEMGQVPEKVRRLAGLLAQKVTEAGGMTTGAARKTFASRDRHLYRAVVDCAVACELLVEGGAGLVPAGLRVAG